MIKKFLDDVKSNIWYSAVVALVLCWFTGYLYLGKKYFPDSGVQKNAGYSGPIPHSGYGVRFYHK
jgi:hypothetical protein